MKERLEAIKSEALRQIAESESLEKLNEIRVAFLGKKGELTNVLKSLKDVAKEDRPMVGQLVNDARAEIETVLDEKKVAFEAKLREENPETRWTAGEMDKRKPIKVRQSEVLLPLYRILLYSSQAQPATS